MASPAIGKRPRSFMRQTAPTMPMNKSAKPPSNGGSTLTSKHRPVERRFGRRKRARSDECRIAFRGVRRAGCVDLPGAVEAVPDAGVALAWPRSGYWLRSRCPQIGWLQLNAVLISGPRSARYMNWAMRQNLERETVGIGFCGSLPSQTLPSHRPISDVRINLLGHAVPSRAVAASLYTSMLVDLLGYRQIVRVLP